MNLVRSAAKRLRVRGFERRYSCRVYPGGEVLAMNRHDPESIIVGPNTHIRGQLLTFGHGGRISMGSYCYVGENSKVWSAKEIAIGDRVLIAHNSTILDSDTHPLQPVERHRHFVEIITKGHPETIDLREEAVRIEDDVWIGCNVVILKGVTIGRGSVIGAGSVVTGDVPPSVLAAGNPARLVRELTSER